LILSENIILYIVAAAYCCAVYIFTPDYLQIVLPLALATYRHYKNMLHGYQLNFILAALPTAAVLIDFRFRNRSPFRADIYYLLALIAGGYLYVLANNGWGYTYYPLLVFVGCLLAWTYMEYRYIRYHNIAPKSIKLAISGMRGAWISFIGLMLVGTYSMLNIQMQIYYHGYPANDHALLKELGAELEADPPAHSFLMLTDYFTLWVNLAYLHHIPYTSRFNHLWMAPALFPPPQGNEPVNVEKEVKRNWIWRYLVTAEAEDLTAGKPDIVFVDVSPNARGFGNRYFDVLNLLKTGAAFSKAWKTYAYIKTVDHCEPRSKNMQTGCRFDIYRRHTIR
jgi:hypothetical protein